VAISVGIREETGDTSGRVAKYCRNLVDGGKKRTTQMNPQSHSRFDSLRLVALPDVPAGPLSLLLPLNRGIFLFSVLLSTSQRIINTRYSFTASNLPVTVCIESRIGVIDAGRGGGNYIRVRLTNPSRPEYSYVAIT